MSLLLQETVKKTRFTSYQELCDTINKKLVNLNQEEKIKLEQDQKKIIEEFKAQAIFQIACLQRRLITISRELYTIQQADLLGNQNSEASQYSVEGIECKEKFENYDDKEISSVKKFDNEKEEKENVKDIYSQKVLNKINVSNSQDISPMKTGKAAHGPMNMTYSNISPRRKERPSKRYSALKKSSDSSKSSSSSISYSRGEIRHMERNCDLYYQTMSRLEKDSGSRIMSESSQRSSSMRQRKRMEKMIHNFKEEVKNIGNQYPKNKKIKS